MTSGHGDEKPSTTNKTVTTIDTKASLPKKINASKPTVVVKEKRSAEEKRHPRPAGSFGASPFLKTPPAPAVSPEEVQRIAAQKKFAEMKKYAMMQTQQQTKLTFQQNPNNILKIKAAFNEQTEFEFIDTPLQDVIEFISDYHKIQILFDTDAAISKDEQVNLVLSDVTLESALNRLLEPLQLDYIIKDEVLLITESADEHMETVIYNLKDIKEQPAEFCKIIEQMIDPAGWIVYSPRGKGGGGIIGPPIATDKASAQPLKDAMVVRQTQRNHRKIVKLLEQFQRYRNTH